MKQNEPTENEMLKKRFFTRKIFVEIFLSAKILSLLKNFFIFFQKILYYRLTLRGNFPPEVLRRRLSKSRSFFFRAIRAFLIRFSRPLAFSPPARVFPARSRKIALFQPLFSLRRFHFFPTIFRGENTNKCLTFYFYRAIIIIGNDKKNKTKKRKAHHDRRRTA